MPRMRTLQSFSFSTMPIAEALRYLHEAQRDGFTHARIEYFLKVAIPPKAKPASALQSDEVMTPGKIRLNGTPGMVRSRA